MQKTRREAIDELLGYVGELGDVEARKIAQQLLPLALQTIWLAHNWQQFVMPMPWTLSAIAGQSSYVLPFYFGRVNNVDGKIRSLTHGREIYPAALEDLQREHPEIGTSFERPGVPCRYAIGGTQGVHTQPPTGDEPLEALSDNAADVTVRVAIEGIDLTGTYTAREVRLQGTSRVALGDWRYVQNFGKSYPAGTEPTNELTSSEGAVTLRTVGDQVALVTLQPDENAREYSLLTLWPKPIAAETIAVPIMRRPREPLYDADVLPQDWWPAIFEELLIRWRANTGEISLDVNVPRPELAKLIANDNINRPRPRVRSFAEYYG